ncbi:MAG: hypothetical protein GX372_07455 [Ignavibacteria bacterium]|nr:hypothetical protein [Ignavibacteria bacterium]
MEVWTDQFSNFNDEKREKEETAKNKKTINEKLRATINVKVIKINSHLQI